MYCSKMYTRDVMDNTVDGDCCFVQGFCLTLKMLSVDVAAVICCNPVLEPRMNCQDPSS